MSQGKFNYKIFTSYLLTTAFIMLVVSGLVLYVSPAGRIANWTNWSIVGLSKVEWTNLHLTFMVIFLVAGIFHLFYFNWKQFWSYLKAKGQSGMRFKREFTVALALFAIVLVGTQAKLPPVISVADLGEYLSESWEDNEKAGPVAHAELLTLAQYAGVIQEPLEKVLETLKKNGYEASGEKQTVGALASKYGVAPSTLDALFKQGDTYASGVAPTGAGYGKMELTKLVVELGMTVDEAKKKLGAAGIAEVKDSDTLKDIATRKGMTPIEVFTVLAPDKAAAH